MSPMLRRTFRRSLTVAVPAVLLGIVAVAAPSSAATPSGSFYVLRSQATGNPASAADDAACDNYLGTPRKYLTLQRLDAVLNAPAVATGTGEITNGTATRVAPGYLCAAIGGDGAIGQSYARATLPSIGAVELAGPCNLSLSVAQLGSALADCRLGVLSAPAGVGGAAQTNSITNPASTEGAQTGSVLSAYVLGARPANDSQPASGAPVVVPGAKFWVLRSSGATVATGLSECPFGWRARVSTVRAAQPSAATGRVLPSTGPPVGKITTCYSARATTGKVSVKTTLQLTSPARTIVSEGDCTQTTLAAGPGTVVQTCGAFVRAPVFTVQDGLVTGTVLVPSGDSSGTVDGGIWTVTELT